MKNNYLLYFLFLGFLGACKSDPPASKSAEVFTIPNTPESICRLWQKVFIDMACKAIADTAICKYTLREDGDLIEDYFSLIRLDNQWLIHIEESASNDPEEAIFEQMKKSLEL